MALKDDGSFDSCYGCGTNVGLPTGRLTLSLVECIVQWLENYLGRQTNEVTRNPKRQHSPKALHREDHLLTLNQVIDKP